MPTPGTPQQEGKKWHTSTIKRILGNEIYGGTYFYNKKNHRGVPNPREEWIGVAVPSSGIPKDTMAAARANLTGVRPSRADNRFWELSGIAFCSCGRMLGCKVKKKNTAKGRLTWPYYVCNEHLKGDECSNAKYLNAENLEATVYHALQKISPQDVEAQIQQLIDKERAPESEIKAEFEVLEDVARQRMKYQQMAARDLLTLDELEVHVSELDSRKMAAERRLEMLQNTSERVKRLELMKRNPILRFVGQTKEQRRDYYKDIGLRVVADKDKVEISGVFGFQIVAEKRLTAVGRVASSVLFASESSSSKPVRSVAAPFCAASATP